MTNEAGLEFEPNSSGNRLGDNLIEKVREHLNRADNYLRHAILQTGGHVTDYIGAAHCACDEITKVRKVLAALEAKPTYATSEIKILRKIANYLDCGLISDARLIVSAALDGTTVHADGIQPITKPTDAPDKDRAEALAAFDFIVQEMTETVSDADDERYSWKVEAALKTIRAALHTPAAVPDGGKQ